MTLYRKMVNLYKKKFNLEDCKITITFYKTTNKFWGDGEAYCYQKSPKNYELSFREDTKTDPCVIAQLVAHEMRHVYQYERGWLKLNLKSYWWKGKKYLISKVPYRKRQYEIQAFRENKIGANLALKKNLIKKEDYARYYYIS